jgi:hypothetical protein
MRPPHEHRAPPRTAGEARGPGPIGTDGAARIGGSWGAGPSPWIPGTWSPGPRVRPSGGGLRHARRSVVVAGLSPLGRAVWTAARRAPELLCTRELLDERVALRVIVAETPDFAIFCDVVDDRDLERFALALSEMPDAATRGVVLYTDGEATVCVSPGLQPCEEDLIWRLTEARGRG